MHPGEHLDWVELHSSLEAALATPNCRLQLVGGKGAGKSTTLKALAARWSAPYFYLPPGARSLPALPPEGDLLLDEVDRLPLSLLTGLETRRARTVLGVHRALALPSFTAVALEPLVSFGWLERRIASVTLPGAASFDFVKLAKEISPRFRDVKYAVLRVLYEVAEDLARGEGLNLQRAELLACADETVAAHRA